MTLYFRELTEACVGANENRRHEALDNAAQDTGLQPLLPYLVTFIAEGVSCFAPLSYHYSYHYRRSPGW
ncbi:unnamed protein product [Dibothriocephalus latus]|uniref:TAF6 C-terminal HEAT repeat domain-containing protein n=1 Tax=Dibothriocephalus latus TaxID=60516 RepID=A0A3P7QKZ8_DIBLA|nr:unnamed protein product [Dibothriocephalus latus]